MASDQVPGLGWRASTDNCSLRQYEFSNRCPPSESLEFRRKQIQFGYRSQEKLIELIEARDGAAAEAHWVRHMKAAGDVWLHGISRRR